MISALLEKYTNSATKLGYLYYHQNGSLVFVLIGETEKGVQCSFKVAVEDDTVVSTDCPVDVVKVKPKQGDTLVEITALDLHLDILKYKLALVNSLNVKVKLLLDSPIIDLYDNEFVTIVSVKNAFKALDLTLDFSDDEISKSINEVLLASGKLRKGPIDHILAKVTVEDVGIHTFSGITELYHYSYQSNFKLYLVNEHMKGGLSRFTDAHVKCPCPITSDFHDLDEVGELDLETGLVDQSHLTNLLVFGVGTYLKSDTGKLFEVKPECCLATRDSEIYKLKKV